MKLGRRHVVIAAALVATNGRDGWAQRPGVVRAPRPPCPTGQGDIVGLMLQGPASAGSVAVFGQVFRRGDVPRDAALAARSPQGGALLAVQLDVKTRHADGSARHAVVSVVTPSLPGGAWVPLMLVRSGAVSPPALDLATLLDGRRAVIEVLPTDGAAAWQVDVAQLARDQTPASRSSAAWQHGALATQTRVTLPVPPAAVGGAASPRLVADIAVRSDGTLWLAAWIRNDLALEASGGAAEYALRVTLDGREVLRTEPFRQGQYQAFGRTRTIGRAGSAAPSIHVHPDVDYLAETGAVPLLDSAAGVDERVLARMTQLMDQPSWNMPLSPRGFTLDMGTTGGRGDIGPITFWQAALLASADRRASAFVIGQAEAGGSIPWHFWTAARGSWLSLDDHPRLWVDQRGNPTLTQPVSRDTGWRVEMAHHPAPSAVPYMLTGERWMLDNLQAQGAAVIMSVYPPHRQDGRGLVANAGQVRAQAWSLRDVMNAAWFSPDGTPEMAYFRKVEDRNFTFLVASLPDWTKRQGAPHGWIPGTNGGAGLIAPWQQDYFAMTVAVAAMRGNEQAAAVLRWQSNFLIGRFTNEANGFRPPLGAGYQLAVSDSRSSQQLQGNAFQSWAEMDAQSEQRRILPPKAWGSVNYNHLALASMAGIYNALNSREAADTFATLSRQMTGTALADFQQQPTFAIVPRGFTRAAGAATSCARSSR